MQINSSIIYSMWPPLFFNKLLQSSLKSIARGTQNFLGDQGPFPLQFGLQILERIMRNSAGLALEDGPHRKVQRIQVRAPWGPVRWTPGCGPESTVGSFLSHVRAPSLAGRSKVLSRSALVSMATVHLPKCLRCTAGCSISLLRARKRGNTFQWLWRPTKP